MNYGVDRYKRPAPISASEEQRRQQEREEYQQRRINDLWRTIPRSNDDDDAVNNKLRFPEEPQENILYFIEKNAPLLETWQREIVRIVRKLGQYFYPQRQTQVMNEGWASFWHYTLLHSMYEKGLVNDGFMLEFLQSHTAVVYQPPFNSPWYSGLIPTPWAFRSTPICGASASTQPMKTGSGSRTSPVPTGSKPCISPWPTSRMKASSSSSCRPR